jgi:SOS response regulatory protein OraA/RecX
MLEKLRRTKSPQQCKEEAYANEHRYCYEYRNAAVRAWAKKKRRNQREARHKVEQLAVKAVLCFEDEDAGDRLADNARVLRGYRKLHKSGVLTLRDVIEHKRATGRRPIY